MWIKCFCNFQLNKSKDFYDNHICEFNPNNFSSLIIIAVEQIN